VQGDERTRRALAAKGIELVTLPGHLLFHRDKIRVDMEREKYFFGTLMPFVHAAEKCGGKPGAPAPAPPHAPIAETPSSLDSGSLDALGLIPASDVKLDWSSGIRNEWDVSEAGAAEAWAQFRRVGLAPYEDGHGRSDLTHKSSTSVLSPYLRFGQISPRRMYSELREPKFGVDGVEGRRLSRTFWHRLYRREFAYWQLGVFPELATTSWRSHYEHRNDWRWPESDENALEDLRRWRRGETGESILISVWAIVLTSCFLFRVSNRRRRDAPADRDWLDAPDGAYARRDVFSRLPGHTLAVRRAMVPRPPRGRGLGGQLDDVAKRR
jgi:deoxyribodipyrimidine photo-lyase